jgi:hypothetical protein
VIKPSLQPEWDESGAAHTSFASTDDPHYREMLAVIRQVRAQVLAKPRVDMPGAQLVGGECRMQVVPPLRPDAPTLTATVSEDASVLLSWPRTADTIGLQYELHRSQTQGFQPEAATQVALTTAGRFTDATPPRGTQYYALLLTTDRQKSQPSYAEARVPQPRPPGPPRDFAAKPLPGEIQLTWQPAPARHVGFRLFRRRGDSDRVEQLTEEPLADVTYSDVNVEPEVEYEYLVRAVDRRGQLGPASSPVTAAARPVIREPVFVAPLSEDAAGRLLDGRVLKGQVRGHVAFSDGSANFRDGGHLLFPHQMEFDLRHALSVECWLLVDEPTNMPVILACGAYQNCGWFLQRYGRGWRWHVGGASCDGGSPVVGQWVHLAATYDGREARLYQNGRPVARTDCQPNRQPWSGPLCVGQYSRVAPDYQVKGRINGVKIFQRAISAAEVAAAHAAGPPTALSGKHGQGKLTD